MDEPENRDKLVSLAVREMAGLLNALDVGSHLQIDSASGLCPVLELLLPQVMARDYDEWSSESLDGFYFCRAVKTGPEAMELAGTCILISDQAMTPFRLNAELVDRSVVSLRIRMGEALDSGRLGISGPAWGSSAAAKLLDGLDRRLDRVDWAYDSTF